MSRILTALVAIPLLLGVVLLAPAWGFSAVVAAAALAGYWELSRIGKAMGMPPVAFVGYPACLAFILPLSVPAGSGNPFPIPAIALVAGIILIIACSAIFSSSAPSRSRVAGLGFTLLASTYVGMLGFLAGIRHIGTDTEGRGWVLFLLLVVMMSDVGAYYTGRSLGRHKLAPSLSPKKTVEGLIGGVSSGALAAAVYAQLVPGAGSWLALGTLGLGLSLLGVAGDLFESFLKRAADVKDASALIPGHGGVLDRLDSLLFAAPVLWLYLQL